MSETADVGTATPSSKGQLALWSQRLSGTPPKYLPPNLAEVPESRKTRFSPCFHRRVILTRRLSERDGSGLFAENVRNGIASEKHIFRSSARLGFRAPPSLLILDAPQSRLAGQRVLSRPHPFPCVWRRPGRSFFNSIGFARLTGRNSCELPDAGRPSCSPPSPCCSPSGFRSASAVRRAGL